MTLTHIVVAKISRVSFLGVDSLVYDYDVNTLLTFDDNAEQFARKSENDYNTPLPLLHAILLFRRKLDSEKLFHIKIRENHI